jgi:hypothetical protein
MHDGCGIPSVCCSSPEGFLLRFSVVEHSYSAELTQDHAIEKTDDIRRRQPVFVLYGKSQLGAQCPDRQRPHAKAGACGVRLLAGYSRAEDTDQETKSTFSLLMELARLELTGKAGPGPQLALPIGGK